jgi:hypothetical protein
VAPTIFWIRTHPATSWDNIFLWDTSETTDSAVRVSLKKSNNSQKIDFLHLKFLPEFLPRLPDDPDAVFVCCLGRMDIKGNMKDNDNYFYPLRIQRQPFFLSTQDFYRVWQRKISTIIWPGCLKPFPRQSKKSIISEQGTTLLDRRWSSIWINSQWWI